MKERDIKNEFERRKKSTTEDDLKKVLGHEEEINKKSRKGPLAKFWDEIQLMLALLKEYLNGDYREVSWGTITSIVVVLLYVFYPLDLIPDVIPALGLLDDAMMVTLCLKMVHIDLEKYQKFNKNKEEIKSENLEGF